MNDDPIVDEVHRAREALWEKCGRDWQKLADYLRAREAEHADRVRNPKQDDPSKTKTTGTPAA